MAGANVGSNPSSFINPLVPPNIKITSQLSAQNDSLYTLSRLRDKKLCADVRLYLAYLHDQDNDVCFEGKTKTQIKMNIHQEGLPTNFKELYSLYVRFCASHEISEAEVRHDLKTFRSHAENRRRIHLQNARDAEKRWFRP